MLESVAIEACLTLELYVAQAIRLPFACLTLHLYVAQSKRPSLHV